MTYLIVELKKPSGYKKPFRLNIAHVIIYMSQEFIVFNLDLIYITLLVFFAFFANTIVVMASNPLVDTIVRAAPYTPKNLIKGNAIIHPSTENDIEILRSILSCPLSIKKLVPYTLDIVKNKIEGAKIKETKIAS